MTALVNLVQSLFYIKILVTEASRYIGGRLMLKLLDKDHQVKVFV